MTKALQRTQFGGLCQTVIERNEMELAFSKKFTKSSPNFWVSINKEPARYIKGLRKCISLTTFPVKELSKHAFRTVYFNLCCKDNVLKPNTRNCVSLSKNSSFQFFKISYKSPLNHQRRCLAIGSSSARNGKAFSNTLDITLLAESLHHESPYHKNF